MKLLHLSLLFFFFLGLVPDVRCGVASSVAQLQANELSPVNFSFSVQPTPASSRISKSHAEGNLANGTPYSNSGVMVNTAVESGLIQGGLSYFNGLSRKSSTPDKFALFYSFKGWNSSETLLLLPNENGGTTSAANFFDQDTNGNRIQAVSLYGGYDLTPSIKIKGAFLISKSHNNSEPIPQVGFNNSSYSWWLDVGGDYKLSDTMTYSINFGYYDTQDTIVNSATSEIVPTSVYLFNNQLNMSF